MGTTPSHPSYSLHFEAPNGVFGSREIEGKKGGRWENWTKKGEMGAKNGINSTRGSREIGRNKSGRLGDSVPPHRDSHFLLLATSQYIFIYRICTFIHLMCMICNVGIFEIYWTDRTPILDKFCRGGARGGLLHSLLSCSGIDT